ASGKSYDFNTADKMNCLLVNALLATGQLKSGQEYDFDFDHQFIETEKYDAKPTYKKFLGYSPGVAVINDMIVGIENRGGNTNVRFNQKETLERIFKRLEASEIYISRARMDCGSCSEEIVDMVEAHCRHFYIRANRCSSFYDSMFALTGWKTVEINGIEFELNSILVEKWKEKPYRLVIQRQRRIEGDLDIWEGEYTYRCILTNDYKSSARDIVEFYNLRGGKERIFDDMNNGFGWNRLPKSFMAQNTVFLLVTALIRNFYKAIMQRLKTREFGLRATSRIKTFVFKFISVPAKWIKTSRRDVLNIYSENNTYANLFKTDFG
ncbi:IS1380 family transposase, partial [Segatella copri]